MTKSAVSPSRTRLVRILYSSRIRLRVTASLSPLFWVSFFTCDLPNDSRDPIKKKRPEVLEEPLAQRRLQGGLETRVFLSQSVSAFVDLDQQDRGLQDFSRNIAKITLSKVLKSAPEDFVLPLATRSIEPLRCGFDFKDGCDRTVAWQRGRSSSSVRYGRRRRSDRPAAAAYRRRNRRAVPSGAGPGPKSRPCAIARRGSATSSRPCRCSGSRRWPSRFIQAIISTSPVSCCCAIAGTSPSALNLTRASSRHASSRSCRGSQSGEATFQIGDQVADILQAGMDPHQRPLAVPGGGGAQLLRLVGRIRLS